MWTVVALLTDLISRLCNMVQFNGMVTDYLPFIFKYVPRKFVKLITQKRKFTNNFIFSFRIHFEDLFMIVNAPKLLVSVMKSSNLTGLVPLKLFSFINESTT